MGQDSSPDCASGRQRGGERVTMGPLSKPVVVCRDSNEVGSQPHGRLVHRQRPGRRESYVRNLAPRGGAPSGLGAFRERKRAGENTARHAFPPSSSAVFVHLFGRVRLPISAPGPLRWVPGPCPFVAENWQLPLFAQRNDHDRDVAMKFANKLGR